MDGAGHSEAFLITVVTGAILGFMFDCCRLHRRIVRPHPFWGAVLDLIFWLISTAVVFLVLFHSNGGEVRIYVFLGLLSGAMLYFRLLSRVVLGLMIAVLRFLSHVGKRLTALILWIFIRPAVRAMSALNAVIRAAFRKVPGGSPNDRPPQ